MLGDNFLLSCHKEMIFSEKAENIWEKWRKNPWTNSEYEVCIQYKD